MLCLLRGMEVQLTPAAFLTQTVPLDSSTNIKFEIWDTVSCHRQAKLTTRQDRSVRLAPFISVDHRLQVACAHLLP